MEYFFLQKIGYYKIHVESYTSSPKHSSPLQSEKGKVSGTIDTEVVNSNIPSSPVGHPEVLCEELSKEDQQKMPSIFHLLGVFYGPPMLKNPEKSLPAPMLPTIF